MVKTHLTRGWVRRELARTTASIDSLEEMSVSAEEPTVTPALERGGRLSSLTLETTMGTAGSDKETQLTTLHQRWRSGTLNATRFIPHHHKQFEITLARCGSQELRLGALLELVNDKLKIKYIEEGGLLAKWNRESKRTQILSGHQIIAVNGLRGSGFALLREVQKEATYSTQPRRETPRPTWRTSGAAAQ